MRELVREGLLNSYDDTSTILAGCSCDTRGVQLQKDIHQQGFTDTNLIPEPYSTALSRKKLTRETLISLFFWPYLDVELGGLDQVRGSKVDALGGEAADGAADAEADVAIATVAVALQVLESSLNL